MSSFLRWSRLRLRLLLPPPTWAPFEKITAFVEMLGGCWIVLKFDDAVVLLTGVKVVFAVS